MHQVSQKKWPEDVLFWGAPCDGQAQTRRKTEKENTMPGLVPPIADEREALLAFLSQQRDALRYASQGLTDEQARSQPSASALCVGGLIKHAAQVERAWVSYLTEGDTSVFAPGEEQYTDGFRLVEGETLADVIAFSGEQAALTEKVVTERPDLGAPLPATEDVVPWIPAGLVWTPRWILLHLIEETARHAGHADIIRESIDGATCWTLMAAAEGWPEQSWT
jgi:uncharacterized damage-inducible protein DinB